MSDDPNLQGFATRPVQSNPVRDRLALERDVRILKGESVSGVTGGSVGSSSYNSVLNYGAASGSDSTVAFQSALTVGGKLYVPGGRFILTSGLNCISNTEIHLHPDAIIDGRSMPHAATFFRATGTEGSSILLTNDTAVSGKVVNITAGTTGISAGDLVRISSNTIFDPGRTNTPIGEIVYVDSVASGVVNLRSPLAGGPYLVSQGAAISRIVPVTNISFTGEGTIIGGGSGSVHIGATLDRVVNFRSNDITLIDLEATGFQIIDTIDARVVNAYVSGSSLATSGYGVSFINASQNCAVEGGYYERCRHAVTTGATSGRKGIARRIDYIGIHVADTVNGGDALDTHACSEDVSFIDSHIYNSAGMGINIECARAKVRGGVIWNTASHGVSVSNWTTVPSEYTVTEVEVFNPGGDGLRADRPGDNAKRLELSGTVTSAKGNGLSVTSNQTGKRWSKLKADVTIDGVLGSYGAYISAVDGGTVDARVDIAAGKTGVRLEGPSRISVRASTELGAGSGSGIEVRNGATLCAVTGSTTTGGNYGIFEDNTCSYNIMTANNLHGSPTTISSAGTGSISTGNL